MKIAIDAMGGDNAPNAIVKGVERARDEFLNLEFLLYGNEEKIRAILKSNERIEIIHTTEIIEMNDEPVKAIRRKKDSSMVQAAIAVKEKRADALFSCGNTGALLASGLLLIGRIKGIARPGLLSTLPILEKNVGDGSFNLLDSGANADSKAEQLYQYAVLGTYYAKNIRGLNKPRVGLLNNGTEPHKGNKTTLEAYQLIKEDTNINFIGNVESRNLLNGVCDIVIADGFTGNAVLKAIEGSALSVMKLLKNSIMSSGVTGKLGALLLKPTFRKIKDKMNQAQYGGAVLLGVKSPVVKAHGSSDSLTVYYTIKQIKNMLETKMIEKFSKLFIND